MATLTHTGPGRALLAALAITALLSGYAVPLATAATAVATVRLARRIRRWRPDRGMLAAVGLALVAGATL